MSSLWKTTERLVAGLVLVALGGASAGALASQTAILGAGLWASEPSAAAPARRRREPPPPVIPIEETEAAEKLYRAGRYPEAVAQAKVALHRNERHTPAMLVLAKAYYKSGKYEWVKTIWDLMKANKPSESEKAEMHQLLAFMEIEKENIPGAIDLLRKATTLQPTNAVYWNNLGAQYLRAKNYTEAVPVLEKATQLAPNYARAHMNLGSAYRGVKQYERAKVSYDKALQLFPNYADAVFNLGILFLDAAQYPQMDTTQRLNTAISYFGRYREMMGSRLAKDDPVESYAAQAQEEIRKEEKRLERQKQKEEREKRRQQHKAPAEAADDGGAAASAGGQKAEAGGAQK